MKIEPKISGWSINDCHINIFPHFGDSVVTLFDIDRLQSKRAAQWIFDHYNIVKLNSEIAGCNYGMLMKNDDICKVSIMENHPELEAELKEYFGETNWLDCYLRFFH